MNALLPDPLAVVLLFVALGNAALGFLVLCWHKKEREQHVTFGLTAFFVALWTLTNALFRSASTMAAATLWAQLSYAAAIGTAAAFLHFAWSFPLHGSSRLARSVLWMMGLGVMALCFVPGVMIWDVDLATRRIVTAPGVYLVAGFMLGASGCAFSLFYRNQKQLRGKRRAQARLVLYGSALTALFGLGFNLALPLLGDYRWVGFGPLCSLFFIGFSAYAIVATHLFDVRLLIRRTFVYSLLLAALAGSFAVFEKAMEHLLLPVIGHERSFSSDLLAALLVGFAADPLKRWLRHVATSRLFQNEDEDEDAGEMRKR